VNTRGHTQNRIGASIAISASAAHLIARLMNELTLGRNLTSASIVISPFASHHNARHMNECTLERIGHTQARDPINVSIVGRHLHEKNILRHTKEFIPEKDLTNVKLAERALLLQQTVQYTSDCTQERNLISATTVINALAI